MPVINNLTTTQKWLRRAFFALVGLNFVLNLTLFIFPRKTKIGYVDTEKITKLFVEEIRKKNSLNAEEKLKEISEKNKEILDKHYKIVQKVYSIYIGEEETTNKELQQSIRDLKRRKFKSQEEKIAAFSSLTDSVAKKKLKLSEYNKIKQLHNTMVLIEKKKEERIQIDFDKTKGQILEAIEKIRKEKGFEIIIYPSFLTCLSNLPPEYTKDTTIDPESTIDVTEDVKKQIGLKEEEKEKKK